jgi:hypothetical protein
VTGPKAIAKAVSLAVAELDTTSSAAEIIKTGSGVGLVMVGPSRYLKDVSGLRMVEIMPNRHFVDHCIRNVTPHLWRSNCSISSNAFLSMILVKSAC